MSNPELSAKPLGFIMMRKSERAEFDALSAAQQGFVLHWWRSNDRRQRHAWPAERRDMWRAAIRKAREQRP